MCNQLIKQVEQNLPANIAIPHEIKMLYQWLENNNLFIDTDGFLYPEDQLKTNWTDTKRDGGTYIEFCTSLNEATSYWFDYGDQTHKDNQENVKEIQQRLYIFAQTGGESSQCALWLDDGDELKIVHMGSGSGSG